MKLRAHFFAPGKWRSIFITLMAIPSLYPLIKNHSPSRQNTAMTVSREPITRFTGRKTRYRRTERDQNQKCEKMCVMAYRITDEDALSVPIFGDRAMMRYGSPPLSPPGVA